MPDMGSITCPPLINRLEFPRSDKQISD